MNETRIEKLERNLKITLENARMMAQAGFYDYAQSYREAAERLNEELTELKRREKTVKK